MSDVLLELKRLRDALSASGDVAYEWNLVKDSIIWLNGSLAANGLSSLYAAANRANYESLIAPEDRPYREEALEKLSVSAREYECEFRMQFGGGGPRWFHDRGLADFAPDGSVIRLRGILRPLTGQQISGARLDYATSHDPLTGLLNRDRLRDALEQALYNCQRYKIAGAYLAIGIDQIPMVNQAFGHEVANLVVTTMADRLDHCLRTSDVVGSTGGSGFGIVLASCPDSELTAAVDKVLNEIRETAIATPSGPIHVTASVGVVAFPPAVGSAIDVMTKAEVALQSAHRSGSDCFIAYDNSETEIHAHREQMLVAERVQRALREKRMTLAYQAVVDAKSRQPVHYECLLRMIEPDGEVTTAAKFMPVVEALGMIRPIDRLALELTVDRLAEYPEAILAVNVSGLTTRDAGWLRNISGLLRGKPDIAARLLVEITETAGLEDIDACASFVATLRDLGCQVALDDFGAGYTSFRHLRQLPVDMVKIDGSFVSKIGENPDNLLFVRTLIDLAQNFGLKTVAECVETEMEAQLLVNEGVDYLQGYLFGVPSLAEPWTGGATITKLRGGNQPRKRKKKIVAVKPAARAR